MRISEEKKAAVRFYLLEKIMQGEKSLSKTVAEAFDMNQATIHTYLNELVEQAVITRTGRGKYELVQNEEHFLLTRAAGQLDSDMYAYEEFLLPRIRHLPQNVRDIWCYAFSEMMNNVMDHSEAEQVDLCIRRSYLDTSVIIEDNGVGIFEKIRSHFRLDSLEDAICELFKGKLTTDAVHHSGEGIFFSSKLMDAFLIFSGGKVFSRDRYDREQLAELEGEGPGTTVYMKLSNFSQKLSRDVFDLYTNEDNQFTKTSVPLKMMFDASPVSRSQAKRVYNRFEEFREIILDFDGLDWMGQGFAHQIFAVYQKEHPELEIIPINMSDGVRSMYLHVLEKQG